jgi:hypothetical protein
LERRTPCGGAASLLTASELITVDVEATAAGKEELVAAEEPGGIERLGE